MEVFDGHCDTILCCYLEGGGLRERPGHLDLTRTRKFSRYAQFFACFGAPEDMPGRPLWEVFQEEVALFRREMAQNADRVVFCRSGREAEAAFAGAPCTDETARAFARAAVAEINPRDSWRASKAFRQHIAEECAYRALRESVERAGGAI